MMEEALVLAGLLMAPDAALEFWKHILLNKMGGKSDE
jgi:hypothetical protein